MVIGALGSQGQLELAFKLLRDLPDRNYRPDVITFTQAVKTCESSSLWQEPLSLLHWMDAVGVAANEVTLGALLGTQRSSFKAGELASDFWRRSISCMASMALHAIEVNAIMFSTILGSCGEEQWARATNIMDKMETTIMPNAFVCSALLSCCVQAAKWPNAIGLWRDVKGHKGKGKLRQIRPDVIMYNSILSACQHCSAASWALELFQEMPKQKINPTTSSYNALLAACESATMWEDCISLLQHMRSSAHGPFPDLISYSSCVRACARAAQGNLVEELLKQMRGAQLQLDSWLCHAHDI